MKKKITYVDNKTHWVNCITRRKCRREAIDAAFIKYVIGEVVTRINLLTTEAKYVYLAKIILLILGY